MSTTIADPLFVRAEVQYRSETWGVTDHHTATAWPALGLRLRRRVAAAVRGSGRPAPRPATRAASVHRPRHP